MRLPTTGRATCSQGIVLGCHDLRQQHRLCGPSDATFCYLDARKLLHVEGGGARGWVLQGPGPRGQAQPLDYRIRPGRALVSYCCSFTVIQRELGRDGSGGCRLCQAPLFSCLFGQSKQEIAVI